MCSQTTWAKSSWRLSLKQQVEPQQGIEDESDERREDIDMNGQNNDESVITVRQQNHKAKKLMKEEVMPTWAATKSLLMSHSSEPHVLIYVYIFIDFILFYK